jgi:hypothetical protein
VQIAVKRVKIFRDKEYNHREWSIELSNVKLAQHGLPHLQNLYYFVERNESK